MFVTAYPVRRVMKLLEASGHDPAQALGDAGIAPTALSSVDSLIPEALYLRLLQGAAVRLGDDQLGLRLAERFEGGETGLLGYLLRHQATLGQALSAAASYIGAFRHGATVEVEEGPERRVLSIRFANTSAGSMYEAQEWIALCVVFARAVVGPSFAPLAVQLRQPAPPSERFTAWFGCPVAFDAPRWSLAIGRPHLDHAIAGADPELCQHLCRAAEHHIARLRRASGQDDRILSLDGCAIDLHLGCVRRGAETLPLTTRERHLLAWFARNANRLVSPDELEREVYGVAGSVLTFAPAVAIRRLRTKIEPDPAHPVNLVTVRGDGWILHVRGST